MYQIRKGWPAQAAIDEVFKAALGETLAEGMIVYVKDHEASVSDTTGVPCFVIGQEPARKTWTGLMSQCVIECDAEHYVPGTYAAGDYLVAEAGKFNAGGTKETGLARVLAYDAVSGVMRVLWFESK